MHLNHDENGCCVLVLYTGGTIGMINNEDGVLAPVPNALVNRLRKEPRLHDEVYYRKRFGNKLISDSPLVLPEVKGLRRVVYTVREYSTLIDSCNMTPQLWATIADDIHENYESYDGFVILHGTDTLCYTASALSFMLENLGKTVIITGSQIPIFEVRSDGNDNFIGALLLAGNFVIPEVTVYFHNKLLRGNRTIKFDSNSFDAFSSPNYQELAKFGTNIEVYYKAIFYPRMIEKFNVQKKMNEQIGLIRMFPNISAQMVRYLLQSAVQGIVLETYGAGNFPTNRTDLLSELAEAVQRGIIIVNCTQCQIGAVNHNYQCGKVLYDAGVLCGFDMTAESALAKLSYVLAKDCDLEMKKRMMVVSLRGEISDKKKVSRPESPVGDLIEEVGRSLQISSQTEISDLAAVLYPALFFDAVLKKDIQMLDKLRHSGGNINAVNAFDGRTALHVACSEGDVKIVEYLLLHGATVHTKDRNGKIPLLVASLHAHHEVIKCLRKCGAHLAGSAKDIGNYICEAAAVGSLKKIQAFEIAGADLSLTDISNRTPLHAAVAHNQREIVEYLVMKKVCVTTEDILGFTPLQYCELTKNNTLADIIKKGVSLN